MDFSVILPIFPYLIRKVCIVYEKKSCGNRRRCIDAYRKQRVGYLGIRESRRLRYRADFIL